MQIRVRYFAVLREQRGVANEEIETSATNPAALYEEIAKQHALKLPLEMLKAAVNGEFVRMDRQLHSGDEVVFLPPVAGG